MRHRDSQRLADEVLVYNFVTIKRDVSFFPHNKILETPQEGTITYDLRKNVCSSVQIKGIDERGLRKINFEAL